MLSNRLLCLAAVVASSSPALAQEAATPVVPVVVLPDPADATVPGGYRPRSYETPYTNTEYVFNNGTGGNFLSSCRNIIEDCRFAPGPWAAARDRLITDVRFGILVLNTPLADEQLLIIFWRLSDLSYEGWNGAGSGMLNPEVLPLAVARVDFPPLDPGFVYSFPFFLDVLDHGGVVVPDGEVGVAIQMAWVTHGCVPANYQDLSTCVLFGCASGNSRGFGMGSDTLQPDNPASVGTTLMDFGRDLPSTAMCPNIGRLIGNGGPPVSQGDFEHRFLRVTHAGVPLNLGAEIRLRGSSLHCGSADFDHDGAAGTDADIAAFFACLAGNCCTTCESADFDGDGDVATDADIEAFFLVLGGGSC